MKSKILEKFDEIFAESAQLSPEKLEALVHESLKFFDDLKDALNSPDEQVKKDALDVAQELQKKLEQQAEKAYHASGMTKEQIENFMNDSANFTQDEWQAYQKAKDELFQYQSDLLKLGTEEPEKKPLEEKKEQKPEEKKKPPKPPIHIKG